MSNESPYATIERGTDGWNLRHHNMPEIQDLFSTDVLPTPFMLVMSADDVLTQLRETMDVPVAYIPTPEENGWDTHLTTTRPRPRKG